MALLLCLALMMVSVEMKSSELELEHVRVKRAERCYGTLGCFSTDYPFTNKMRPAVVPQSPDTIKTKFLLFTRKNRHDPQELDARHVAEVSSLWTQFKGRPTKILIHGFLEVPLSLPWWKDIIQELLTNGDYNVILVDWSGGNKPLYIQATANTRVVGAQISELVKELTKIYGVKTADFHIIGHSLGAHTAGYAGERLEGLGRLTSLDPAGPYFKDEHPSVRVDEGDAIFVDVIHSDNGNLLKLGLGSTTLSGHIDFFPNFGRDQPGCAFNPIKNLLEYDLIAAAFQTAACSHLRSLLFFIESINSQCPYMTYPCANETDFKNNLCHSCTELGCSRMGFHADKFKPSKFTHTPYYLNTGDSSPFCRFHIIVTIKLGFGQTFEKSDEIEIMINGDANTISLSGLQTEDGNSFYEQVINDLGNAQSVSVSWRQKKSIADLLTVIIGTPPAPTKQVYEINVYREEAGVSDRFCVGGEAIPSGTSLTVSKKC